MGRNVPQVQFQKAGGAVHPHGTTHCPMATVKLALCSSSVKHQHGWVWAVQKSQIATRDTSELQLLKTFTSPSSSAKEKSWGRKKIRIGVKKANKAEMDVVLPWLLCRLGCCFRVQIGKTPQQN